ncbi:MAG: tRNA epoxyqueuosine(34) reductase QueG [Bacteroidota bacterium]
MNHPFVISEKFIQKAKTIGFDDIGFSKATFLEKEAIQLEKWLQQGFHGEMKYMENHFDKRLDPRLLVEGAKSVISLSYSYFPEEDVASTMPYKIAKYAYGEDYHIVIKDKLQVLVDYLKQEVGAIHIRAFTDSAPIMERAWAERAGISWIGKNTLALTKTKGSFYFLAEIICDVEFVYSNPVKNYCGTCTKCIDACPTQALYEPYKMDARKCISYLTIELKDEIIPTEFKSKMQNWMYGCDICQDVCPINARAKTHQDDRFTLNPEITSLSQTDWNDLNKEMFDQLFAKSAIKRSKFSGLKRNIEFLHMKK